jgi:CRP/FNR family cyclic AMP-dependent transcriptional regulator
MASKIDPALVQMFAENVRAQIIPRTPPPAPPPAPGLRLDPAIVQKISQRVPVFAGMSTELLLATLGRADTHPVKAGEPVFKEGDVGSAFYVAVSGEFVVKKLRNGEPVTLAKLGTGECFGEMALVRNDVRTATVVALRDSMTMRFERERIDANPESAHIIYRNIAKVLARRLDESSVQLADMVIEKKSTAVNIIP